jgi:hypothetical protein
MASFRIVYIAGAPSAAGAACAALACAVLLCALPLHAKLLSGKARESAMIAKIVPVTERWLRFINDSFDKNEPFRDEITAAAKDYGSLENGIFNDMYIGTDVARLCVYMQRKDGRLRRALDDFDNAAEQLDRGDRLRYYTAKLKLVTDKLAAPADSLKRDWLDRLVADCAHASRNGLDANRCFDIVRRFSDKNGLKPSLPDEASCRIFQDYARFFLTEAKSLRSQGKNKQAFETAMQAIREVPLPVNLDAGSCNQQKSDADLCAAYDRIYIQPLTACAGKRKTDFQVEVCRKNWQQKKLIAAVLPRIGSVLPDAFDLFRRAGEDDALKADPDIAVAELKIWKKAKKLREFKTKYPDRFRLARAAAGTAK